MGSDWISSLFTNLKKLWPGAKVTAWERAIRVRHYPSRPVLRMGYFPNNIKVARRLPHLVWLEPTSTVTELGPGIHLKLWWFDDVHEHSIVPCNYELPIQSITTKDDKSVTIGVNITLEVDNIVLLQTAVHDFEESMYGVCRGHLAKRCRELEWPELIVGQTKLEDSLKGTLTTRLKGWGARVIDVSFTDLAHTSASRLYGEGILSNTFKHTASGTPGT